MEEVRGDHLHSVAHMSPEKGLTRAAVVLTTQGRIYGEQPCWQNPGYVKAVCLTFPPLRYTRSATVKPEIRYGIKKIKVDTMLIKCVFVLNVANQSHHSALVLR